jgi:predicted nucleic acid-binding protein
MTAAMPVPVDGDRIFVDTNILIYAYDAGAGERHRIARSVLEDLWERRAGILSAQVLQEFYNTVVRKLGPRLTAVDARNVIVQYSEWCAYPTDALVVYNAARLHESHRVSWWDALIIESACQAGAKYLLSEDLQDGRKFGALEVRNPFAKLQ